MNSRTGPRQPSFVMFEANSDGEADRAGTSVTRSRLPASATDLDHADNNRSLIDLTPSGEVQMHVTGGRNKINKWVAHTHEQELRCL